MNIKHVVLTTYGEPPTASFQEQLVYSWRILLGLTRTVAPIPKPLIPLIALARARGRRRMWRDHGYGSPLEAITRLQAERLQGALEALDQDTRWSAKVAFEFRRPFLADTLSPIPAEESVCVVPMYAADSDFTHALSRQAVAMYMAKHPRKAPVHVLGAIEPETLAALSAAHVRDSLKDDSGWRGERVALMLAAHGTLIEPVRPMKTGLLETTRLCDAVRRELASDFGLVGNGWLNHTRGGRWTAPAMDVALRRVTDSGLSQVVYFPYGFLADNAETQLEGDMALCAEPGLKGKAVPCLNESPSLAGTLARLIVNLATPARG